jgi:hypothetical protein
MKPLGIISVVLCVIIAGTIAITSVVGPTLAAVDSNNYVSRPSTGTDWRISKSTGALLVQDVGSDLVLYSAKRLTVPSTDANFVKDMGVSFPSETAAVLFIPEQAPDTPISTVARWEVTGSAASATTGNAWANGGQMIRMTKATADKMSVVSSGASMTGSFQVFVLRS